MEKSTSGSKKLQVFIIVLLSLNLVATLFTVIVVSIIMTGSVPSTTAASLETEPLPLGLTTVEERMALFEEIRQNYNTNDNMKLRSMYGKSYQIQLPLREFNEKVKPIRRITSQINDGAYAYYEFEEALGGRNVFTLFYTFQAPEGTQTLKIGITQQGNDPYEIFSFKINPSI